MYGRRTACAVASISRLAEVYDGGITRLSASEVAQDRGFPRPIVAKILSMLSQAGLVTSAPGPGGGFSLARDPSQIRLFDVFRLFERLDEDRQCPFGAGICGGVQPCPLHSRLAQVQDAMDRFLHETTFEAFRNHEPGASAGIA